MRRARRHLCPSIYNSKGGILCLTPFISSHAQVASLVAVLKAARQLSLVKGLEAVAVPGHPPVRIPGALLRQAISASNEGLLVDAMTLACVHPKTATMPGAQTALPGQ